MRFASLSVRMPRYSRSLRSVVGALAVLSLSYVSGASTLYVLNTGFGSAGLFKVSQTDGSTTLIGALPTRSWTGLSSRPGDTTHVYAVSSELTRRN